MNDQTLIVIQARMGSVRLPAKALLTVGNNTIIGLLLDQFSSMGASPFKVCVAIPQSKTDDQLADYLESRNTDYVRGDEHDLIARFRSVAFGYPKVNTFIRLTADNPLISHDMIRCALYNHKLSGLAFSSTRKMVGQTITERYLPKGASIDIFERSVLFCAALDDCTNFDREHLIPKLFETYELNELTKQKFNDFGVNIDDMTFISVDTVNDYEALCDCF